MKVIFVASGNKRVGEVSSFVQSQYDSLKAEGLDMVLFPVVGHGAMAHLRAAWQLRKLVRREKPDVIHAHYSIYGYVAVIACMGNWHKPKIVVSILGSFPRRNKKWKLVRFCVQHVWDKTLVKSERTKRQLGLDVPVIPNGVNLEVFRLENQNESRKAVGFQDGKRYVVWCSNPGRIEKNYKLAQAAVDKVDAELIPVYDKTPDVVVTYMNAADCLLLTSWSEGSPNVIKEAMACNCPIVTTDVGDVTERLENLDGCYVEKTEHPIINQWTQDAYLEENAHELAACLQKALTFGKRTEGRKRIYDDGLTIELTAKKIINWYESI